MWEQMMDFLESWFVYPGLSWDMMLIGIGLGIAFGAIWLCAHWPPLFEKHWLWAVAATGAFLGLIALTFVQIPLQQWVSDAMESFWSQDVLYDWLLLAGIPTILISGLVQEGAKMLPMVFWWLRSGKSLTPGMGLAVGALAGAGFGVFEAVWVHCRIFAAGWTIQAVQTDGFLGIAGFWERFFAVGFHIAASALAGYGLAKGKGWQFFLIAGGLHALLNYGAILLNRGIFTIVETEVYVAVLAVIISAAAVLLRWWQRRAETVEQA